MGCNLGSGGITSALEDMSGAFRHVWIGLEDVCMDALSVLPFDCPHVQRFCPQKILEFVLKSSSDVLYLKEDTDFNLESYLQEFFEYKIT